MNKKDIAQVQSYLRTLFANDHIDVDVNRRKGGPTEVKVDDVFAGVLLRNEEQGDVSFTLTMTILEHDFPRRGVDKPIRRGRR